MRVIYSPRATRDLESIAAYYRTVADPKIVSAIADRIEYVIDRLGRRPQSAPRVIRRTDVRVALVLRYPYKIFYRVISHEVNPCRSRAGDTVVCLASRRIFLRNVP